MLQTSKLNAPRQYHTTNHLSKEKIKLCWLPSLPLIKKYKAPPISGLGILYSEELDTALHVFETDNLKESLDLFSREQAAALNMDPACRLLWLEIENPIDRASMKSDLQAQIDR